MAKINLPTIKARMKAIKDPKKALAAAGEITRGYVLKSWGKGKGPDDIPFNKLSQEYEDYKTKKGRNGIRDLLFTGKMTKSLYVDLGTRNRAFVRFPPAFIGQARGNQKHAENMMEVGDRLKRLITDAVFKIITKG